MYVRNRRETMWWTLACRGVKNEIVYRLIDDENKYTITEENSEILEILTESFKNIFSPIPSDSISAMLPIKVLQVFFINHDYFISLMMK